MERMNPHQLAQSLQNLTDQMNQLLKQYKETDDIELLYQANELRRKYAQLDVDGSKL